MHLKVVVPNSVLHDARVLKEADSLAAAGHEVTIIGLFDPKRSDANEHHRDSGVRVRLAALPAGMRVSQILQNLTMGSALVVAAMTGMMFSAIGATEPYRCSMLPSSAWHLPACFPLRCWDAPWVAGSSVWLRDPSARHCKGWKSSR